jgi:MraZ protein
MTGSLKIKQVIPLYSGILNFAIARELASKIRMFLGEYKHVVDAKKRLSLPSKFRRDLSGSVVLTRGLDQSLFLYPHDEWQKIAEKLSSLPAGQAGTRGFVRLMLAGAEEITLDALGRILIPEYLKTYARINQQVVITGVFNRLEIWNEEIWNVYKKKVEKDADSLAEKLGEIGAF